MSPKRTEETKPEEPKGYSADENEKSYIKFVFQDCNINFFDWFGFIHSFFWNIR